MITRAIAGLALALGTAFNVGGQTVITFDNLANEPAANNFAYLVSANGGSSTISGVNFVSGNFVVVGSSYVEQFANPGGHDTFITPESGSYGIFNAFGSDALGFTSPHTLLGIWFAQPDFGTGPMGPSAVTVVAYHNSNVLGTASLSLNNGSTMTFLDTSSFMSLPGITRYEIDRTAGTGPYGGGVWVADSFLFSNVPEAKEFAVFTAFGLAAFAVWRRQKQSLSSPSQ